MYPVPKLFTKMWSDILFQGSW